MPLAMQGLCNGKLGHRGLSEYEIALRHRQYVGRLAGQQNPVGAHLVGLGVHLNLWQGIVQDHVRLADVTGIFYGYRLFGKAQFFTNASLLCGP